MSGTPALARLLLATGNPGKLREMAALFAGLPVEILSLADLATVPSAPAEDGETFADNARLKATAYARASGLACLADDSGFCVDALDGRPGVHSARVPGDDDAGRVQWVYQQLDARGSRQSGAAFVCVMALAAPDGAILHETEGRVSGEIAAEPSGAGGFGYDPIFYFPPAGRTFAEMTRDEKAAVSHRGEAARAMRAWVSRQLEPR